MQGDHKSLIRFEKEKELQPVLYQEPVSPPFDTDIPNESSGSEEEPEAISILHTLSLEEENEGH